MTSETDETRATAAEPVTPARGGLGRGATVAAPKALDFATPKRGASLPSLAPPAVAAPARHLQPVVAEPTPVTPRAARRVPTPRPVVRQARRAAVSDEVGIYLGAALRRRLRAYLVASPGPTFTDVVLDALEAVDADHDHPDHKCLLVPMLQTAVPRTGPLFTGRAPRRRTHVEDQVQITIRPSAQDLAVIDSIAETLGAPNRSALIAAALELYLHDAPGQR